MNDKVFIVTKEQVIQILKNHGHSVVMDSAFIIGTPISEIEAIVDVCDVVAQAAYDQGVKDSKQKRCELCGYLEHELEHTGCLRDRVAELEQFLKDAHTENKKLCETVEDLREANRGLADSAVKKEINEAEELEKAIETIQVALSGSFRDNLKIEVTEQHAWIVYSNLKFLVEPMEAWQALQSCVYLSGLEVDNET